ncbi:SusD/RagB family nutrient-binding outer membrane lipoprotein [Robertkochia sediminum]|uniref:SusD/RagB family nutrient-binding outer membrane lipoprotein n=1 Tax=Robertkochia sediminum TaxID=2785326 RepID=UPI0019316EBE|nr:SusD/RagB family nutrient-binding outer membrane lipoprotein [Robertkochia sediminum]MBL7472821.1 SusD/RagB family nutrient-binding outer membrane lipoprotein [Robertkochia sediminum]
MKNSFKKIGLGLVSALSFMACETLDLDITENPNALTPGQADVDFFANAIQLNYVDFVESMGITAGQVVRQEVLFDRNYLNAFAPISFNGEWNDVYRGILTNLEAMRPLAEESELFYHVAMGEVLAADAMITLVDFFGPVPFSEAISGDEGNFNPAPDSGEEVYAAALALLDGAINKFNGSAAGGLQNDFFYDNDVDNWIKLANTLKMKIYLQTRLVNPNAISEFNAIVASGEYIDENSEDFQFFYGTNENQPDNRHPRYADDYTPSGAINYQSNWLMNNMIENGDPRLQYYFYRQVSAVPGQEIDPNEETIDCSLETAPQHYIDGGFTFCALPNGYWGRDHGDDSGTPPDGFLRTAAGVYPAAGNFDDGRFDPVAQGDGGQGAGITPIMLASYVDMMKAEVAAISDPAAAKPFLIDALNKHIEKVQSFGALDASADATTAPDGDDVTNFLNGIEIAFDAADNDGKWDIIGEQLIVTTYGNGLLPFNFYRRTGFPTTLQPNREPDPGAVIRSFRYPANSANNNSSITQRQNVTFQVFWDTNPASPAFPVAN